MISTTFRRETGRGPSRSHVEAFIDAGLCGPDVASHAAFARLVLGWDWKTAMWVGITFQGFDLTPERARAMALAETRLSEEAHE